VQQATSHDAQHGRLATHCNTLQHIAAYWQLTATHCSTLQHVALRCNTLQQTAAHCNKLQQTQHCKKQHHLITNAQQGCLVKLCNTLQHAATRCNSLQLTARRYNTAAH